MGFLSQVASDFGASPAAATAANAPSQNGTFSELRKAIRKQHPELPPEQGMAKGGLTAKGWGKARGARGAKVY